MSRANIIQTNFTAGEVSPFIKGRVDISKYQNGADKLLNFIVRPQGGISARPGSLHILNAKSDVQANSTRLVPFEFSDTVGYVIEFGNLYVRYIYDVGYCVNGSAVILEAVTPYTSADLKYLQFAQSGDILYIAHPSYPPQQIRRTSDGGVNGFNRSVFIFGVLTFRDGPYLSTNQTDTQLTISSVIDLGFLESTANDFVVGDIGKYVTYLLNGDTFLGEIVGYSSPTLVTIKPITNIIPEVDLSAKLSYSAPTVSSTLAIFSRANVGAYIRIRETDRWYLITVFNSTTSLDVTAALTMITPPTGVIRLFNQIVTSYVEASAPVFVASDDGRFIRLDLKGKQIWGEITLFVNSSTVFVDWDRSIPLDDSDLSRYASAGKTTRWRLGAWSASTGYPSTVAFHEERLVFAASPTEPQTMWFSVSGDYQNFAPTEHDSVVLDDSAITATLASGKINAIKWLNSGPTLIVGTLGAPWQVSASTLKEALTPTNFTAQQQGSVGSTYIPPIRIGASVMFLQRSGRKLRELTYSYEVDSLVDRDATIISEHLLRNGTRATALAFQEDPHNILWIALEDGHLAGLTYVKDQEVYAWHLHEMGGSFGSASFGFVESICTIPSASGLGDYLYLCVLRTIDGVTKRYVERLTFEPNFTSSFDVDSMVYLDSAKIKTGSPGLTVTAAHLPDTLVSILADGARRADVTTDGSGVATYSSSITNAVIGLKYNSLVKTLTPEAGAQMGTAQGQKKRISSMTLRVLSSEGFKYGPSDDNLSEYSMRDSADPMDDPPPLRSGDVNVTIEGDTEYAPQLVILRDGPYPLNILAIISDLKTNE